MVLTTEQAKAMSAKSGTKKRGKQLSLRACIDKACKQCIFDPYGGAGTWRQQAANCTDTTCGLYPARPLDQVTKKIDSSADMDA